MSLPLLKETINHPRDETCGGKEGVIVMKAKRNRRNTAVGEALRIFFFFLCLLCAVHDFICGSAKSAVHSAAPHHQGSGATE